MGWAFSRGEEVLGEKRSMSNSDQRQAVRRIGQEGQNGEFRLHPAWLAFIRHCRELGFGEISQLKIQDGLPVMAEETKKKVKFI